MWELRHVGYAIPTESLGPFVPTGVEVPLTITSDMDTMEPAILLVIGSDGEDAEAHHPGRLNHRYDGSQHQQC